MATTRFIRTSPPASPDNDECEHAHETFAPKSPVPLSREEAANAEICKLAAKLAPVFEATDALFCVPAEFQRQSSLGGLSAANNIDDDDDMDSELQGLSVSEDLLRQELQHAEEFSALFSRLSPQRTSSTGSAVQEETPVPTAPQDEASSSPAHDEADNLNEEQDEIPEQRVLAGLPPIRIPDGKKSAKSTPSRSPKSDPSSVLLIPQSPPGTPSLPYTNQDHFKELRMQREERGGWYSCDLTRLVSSNGGSQQGNDDNDTCVVGMKEYVLTIPETKLRHLFVGLPESKTTTPVVPLPVRTVSIRIRPDVLCGAVMDAVHSSLTRLNARVSKRQGGHIRAVISEAVVSAESTSLDFTEDNSQYDENGYLSLSSSAPDAAAATPDKAGVVTTYPPFLVDVQLCTHKSSECERMLLVRIYHLTEEDSSDAVVTEDVVTLPSEADALGSPSSPPDDEYLLLSHYKNTITKESVNTTAALHLRECSALVQRMESPAIAKRIRPSPGPASPNANANASFTSHNSVKELVSEHLRDTYRACPSVKDGNITLPGLNSDDWPVVLSSWRFLQTVWDELETRDLTYTTLCTLRFGAFPALPTLDVHYCSQIRRLSREAMIVQLLKSASELEEYAREAEFACANMIALLRPTLEAYGIDAPSLPKPVALTAYPLDFTAPQASCPPWGIKVMEALNEVQALTGDAGKGEQPELQLSALLQSIDSKKSLGMAQSAVELVLMAFQKQDDEEQSARLGRKNMQVMDRLAKMQAHQRASIQTIQNSIRLSDKAAKSAQEFLAKAKVREVPLLKWSIVVGKSTGTCWVTANHLLFVTQLIPYIGGNTTTLLRIEDIDFELQETPPSLLNPLPTVISIKQNGQEVYSFRPSTAGARLKSFLGIVKGVAMDDPLDMPDQLGAVTLTLDYGQIPTV